MSRQERIERHDALYKLLTNLPGADFGAAPECAETDPDLFFPEPGEGHLVKFAVAICNRCPIRNSCREQGIRGNEPGIWGGTTENERRKMRRERRLASQDQEAA